MTLMLPLLVGVALAGPQDPVVAGDDLVAWRALQEQTDPGAWRGFLLSYPDSPLAELAWRRLVEVGHAPDPTSNPTMSRIAASFEQHEADLARTPEGYAVATLRLEDEGPSPDESRTSRRSPLGLRTSVAPTSATAAHGASWLVVEDPLVQSTPLAADETTEQLP